MVLAYGWERGHGLARDGLDGVHGLGVQDQVEVAVEQGVLVLQTVQWSENSK